MAAVGEKLARGEAIEFGETYFMTTPRFETGDERYALLNGIPARSGGQGIVERQKIRTRFWLIGSNLWRSRSGRGRENTGFQQAGELLVRHGPAEIVALGLVTKVGPEECQLGGSLHALSDHP
jgi:hypothetical protein